MFALDDLQRRFGDLVALRSVSMHVEPGRMHGFVGRNGAGKTTTMRIALGLIEPDVGTVTWDGRPVAAEDLRRIGYMPEERGLYPKMRCAEQIAYFGELAGMKRADANRSARAVLARLGLEDRLDDELDNLSLGNQQRVQLAAALVHGPDLLILDEPFSGLDPTGVDVLADVLRAEAARGVGIVFSSHQLELVERECEVVTIIDEGRVVADGRIDALRAERSTRRIRITIDGGWTQWIDALPGVEVVESKGDVVVVALGDGADDQDLLDAARAAGSVRGFTPVVPTLAELFRGLLDEEAEARTVAVDDARHEEVPA